MEIRLKPEYYWIGIFALCFTLFQIISYKIRPHYEGANELVKYFLGVAPNFFPAIGIPALFVMIIPVYSNANKTDKWLNHSKHITANVLSLSGLLSWEFLQLMSTKLHFDWNDVLWTIFGAFVFQLIWSISPVRFKEKL